MKLIALILPLFLIACATAPESRVVVETQYIVRTATAAQKQIPPYGQPIDVETGSQIDLAEWIKNSEERQWRLETIIDELVKFYEQPVVAKPAVKVEK